MLQSSILTVVNLINTRIVRVVQARFVVCATFFVWFSLVKIELLRSLIVVNLKRIIAKFKDIIVNREKWVIAESDDCKARAKPKEIILINRKIIGNREKYEVATIINPREIIINAANIIINAKNRGIHQSYNHQIREDNHQSGRDNHQWSHYNHQTQKSRQSKAW